MQAVVRFPCPLSDPRRQKRTSTPPPQGPNEPLRLLRVTCLDAQNASPGRHLARFRPVNAPYRRIFPFLWGRQAPRGQLPSFLRKQPVFQAPDTSLNGGFWWLRAHGLRATRLLLCTREQEVPPFPMQNSRKSSKNSSPAFSPSPDRYKV